MKDFKLNIKLIKSLKKVSHRQTAEIRETVGIPRTTWYAIMTNPESITVQQLLGIANGLHIPAKRFFVTDGKEEEHTDYIAEPYKDCYYDAGVLQEIVDSRTDATWQQAANAAGVTRDNLRKSLLAMSRTPVMRFLSACNVFGINPFKVLQDPNKPNMKKRNGTKESERTEIASLKADIAKLNANIEDLKEKFSQLLNAHEQLAHRVQVNIDTINGNIGSIGIASDPIVTDEG